MQHSGKVIFQNGAAPQAGLQIVFWTTTAAPAAISSGVFPEPFVPTYDAVTDASGEFTFDIPDGQNTGLTGARVTIMGSSSGPVDIALISDELPLRLIVLTDVIDLPTPSPTDSAPPAPALDPHDACKFELRSYEVQSQQRYLHLARIGNHEGKPPKVKRLTILETRSLSEADIEALREVLAKQAIIFAPYAGSAKSARVVSNAESAAAGLAQIEEMDGLLLATGATSLAPNLQISTTRALNYQTLSVHSAVLQASQIAFPNWWNRPPRYSLDCDQPIDWDHTPTIVQACEPYFYHVLEFVQEVVHAGYQDGPIVGTSTLLPCQEKKIATLSNRNETRDVLSEQQSQREGLRTSVTRALDMKDLQSATMREASSGSSSSSVKSVGAVAGAVLGPVVLGVSGGASKASSVASQNSSRAISGMASKNLRDSVQRAAESIRSSTATVVRTATETEETTATTEVIKNHSKTRTLDLVTHEIYAAFDVRDRLENVAEAIAIPFRMTMFDDEKALRWRKALGPALPNPDMARSFAAIERIVTEYKGENLPPERFADAQIEFIDGTLELEIRVARHRTQAPSIVDFRTEISKLPTWHVMRRGGYERILERWYEAEEKSAAYFAEHIAPKFAQEVVQYIQVKMVDENDFQWLLPLDPTPLTRLDANGRMTVSFNASAPPDNTVTRANLKYLKFQLVGPDNNAIEIENLLPEGSALIIHSGSFDYMTAYDAAPLFRNANIRDDLSGNDVALVPTPLSRADLVSPVDEDIKLRNALLQELNTNLVVYHEAIYNYLAYNNPSHLRMLLDGLFLPGSNDTLSVRDVIGGYIGAFDGCVVFYVGPGHGLTANLFLDDITQEPIPLMALYEPETEADPMRVTTPTGTTFTKTYLGNCPLREKIDDTLAVDWVAPCESSDVSMAQLVSRIGGQRNLSISAFSATDFKDLLGSVNIPEGSALSDQLITALSGKFADITGLAKNQDNAMTAFNTTMTAAQSAHDAADKRYAAGQKMRDLKSAMDLVNETETVGKLSEEDAIDLRGQIFKGLVDALAPKKPEPKKAGDDKTKGNTTGEQPKDGGTVTGTDPDPSTNPTPP